MLGQKQGNFVLPQKTNPASELGKSDYFFIKTFQIYCLQCLVPSICMQDSFKFYCLR